MNNTITDKEIVELYLAREEKASTYCAQKYSERLHRLASSLLLDSRDAEECVNDTFLKAWNAIPPNNPEHLFPFLARICRFTAVDIIRRNKAEKRDGLVVELTHEMEECIPDSIGDAEVPEDILKTQMNDFLGSLSKDKRMIFVRHYWLGESISEISERYDFSESKVKSILHRTREKLRKYIEKKGMSNGLIIIAVAILALAVPVGAFTIRYALHRDNIEHFISESDMVSRKNPDLIKNLTSENDDYHLTLDALLSDGHNAMIIFTSETISENGKRYFNGLEAGIFMPSFYVKYADGSDGPFYHLTGRSLDLPIIVTSYSHEYVEEAMARDDKRSASIVHCGGIDLSEDVKLELYAYDVVAERFLDESAATLMNVLEGIEFTVNLAPNVTCNTLHDADGRQLFLSSFELYSNDPSLFPKTRLCDITFIKESGERMKYEITDGAHTFGEKEWSCFVFGEFIDPNEYAGVEVDGVEFWK